MARWQAALGLGWVLNTREGQVVRVDRLASARLQTGVLATQGYLAIPVLMALPARQVQQGAVHLAEMAR
jgi:hypothetical protein